MAQTGSDSRVSEDSTEEEDAEEQPEEDEEQTPDFEVKTTVNTNAFIEANFEKRVCCRYILDPEQSGAENCSCGHPKNAHPSDALDVKGIAKNTRWNEKDHTKTVPTDAFGEIEFAGLGQKRGKFVRVDYKTTSVDNLWTLMSSSNHWGMKKPKLLISVTGGAQDFTMKPRLKEIFRKGLVRAAESTGAWIITGGTNTGVMKHVGEAIRAHTLKQGSKKQIVAIGIATWGCIENRQRLVNKHKEPVLYKLAQSTAKKKESAEAANSTIPKTESPTDPKAPERESAAEPKIRKTDTPLDPNHTHFILVDNGTQNQFGVEIDLRARLESKICERTAAKSESKTSNTTQAKSDGTTTEMTAFDVPIPIVCVVLEGGINTIETVKKAIDNKTPVLIVEGSGRAADILAAAYHRCVPSEVDESKQAEAKSKRKESSSYSPPDDKFWKEFKDTLAQTKPFGEIDSQKLDNIVSNIRYCMTKTENHKLLSIFSLDYKSASKNIDVAIMKSLLKVNPKERKNQLLLALSWNRIDIVKEEIYPEDAQRPDEAPFNPANFKDTMFYAIVKNRVEFVKFFLEKGFNLGELLDEYPIERFYDWTLRHSSSRHLNKIDFRLWNSLDKDKENAEFNTRLGRWTKQLVDQLFDPTESREILRANFNKPPPEPAPKKIKLQRLNTTDTSEQPDDSTDEAVMKLFYWSILTRSEPMARVFWYEADEKLALALVGHLMLKNLLKKEKDPEAEQQLSKQVSFFEELATGILAECYTSDRQRTVDLLIRKMWIFSKTTALEIAVQADNKPFLAHPACQNLLDEIWTGGLSNENNSLKLLFCVLFFPFACLLKYRKDKLKPIDYDSETESRDAKEKNAEASKPVTSEAQTSPPGEIKEIDVPCSRRLCYFFEAPIVKFSYSCLSYTVLLMLYSIILLTDFHPTISLEEIVLVIWVLTIIVEEVRQIVTNRSGNILRKFYNYLHEPWNIVDVCAAGTFAIGIILRFFPASVCDKCFYASRIVLAFNLMTFYFRILHKFSIRRELGPKLVMIGQMMIDLFYFMIILVVFIIAYGVTSHVILYPNQPLQISLVHDVLSGAWWSVYGEFNIAEVSGDECAPLGWQNLTADDCASSDRGETGLCPGREQNCPAVAWFGPILLAFYALITNVLMINLLIAMFSNTFAKVEEVADVVWKVQRYRLVLEYESHPILPPPFIIFEHLFLLLRYIHKKCKWQCCEIYEQLPKCCCRLAEDRKSLVPKRRFRMQFGPDITKELLTWLSVNVEEYTLRKEPEEAEESEARDALYERIDQILRKLEEVSEAKNYDERFNSIDDRLKKIYDKVGL